MWDLLELTLLPEWLDNGCYMYANWNTRVGINLPATGIAVLVGIKSSTVMASSALKDQEHEHQCLTASKFCHSQGTPQLSPARSSVFTYLINPSLIHRH
jgi:hypothetical protein